MSCLCTAQKGNTGIPSPKRVQKTAFRHILVPFNGSDGQRNCIDLSSDFTNGVIPAAFFEGKFNEADQDDRWYPLPELKNTEPDKTETRTQTYNDGSSKIIGQGSRTFTAIIPNLDNKYLSKVLSHACSKFGMFTIDECGSIWGDISEDGTKLYPAQVDEDTFNFVEVPPTDSQLQALMISWEYKRSVLDQNVDGIFNEFITENLLIIDGLLDIIGTEVTTVPTTITTFTWDARQCYGSAQERNAVKGLQATDLELNNLTTPAVVNIVSMVESTTKDGEYFVTHDGVLATEVIEVSLASSVTGYAMVPFTSAAP
jgi:hypothetical protein